MSDAGRRAASGPQVALARPRRKTWIKARCIATKEALRVVRRAGFGLLALANLVWGGWALIAPAHFFRTFPGFGLHWTRAYPPYNQHLIFDLGATLLTLGVLLGVAAIVDTRAVSWVVAVGVGTFGTLHFGYHALHAGTMGGADRGLSLLSLIGGAFLPPALAATHHLRRS
jgi:hypothetical protein